MPLKLKFIVIVIEYSIYQICIMKLSKWIITFKTSLMLPTCILYLKKKSKFKGNGTLYRYVMYT